MPRMFAIRWMSPRTSAAGALRSARVGILAPLALPSPKRVVSAGVDATVHPELCAGGFLAPERVVSNWDDPHRNTEISLTSARSRVQSSGPVCPTRAHRQETPRVQRRALHAKCLPRERECDGHRGSPGAQTLLATGLSRPQDISLQAGALYWTDLNLGTVSKISTGGGAVTTLVSGLSAPWGIGTDSTSVYFTYASTVAKVPLGGGSVTTLATSGDPYELAVNATDVFWTNPTTQTIMKVPVGGGSATTLGSSLNHPLVVALDGSYIYWTCNWCGTVSKMPLGGGIPTTLAGGLTNPVGIAVDSTYVYYADYVKTTGRVLKASKQ